MALRTHREAAGGAARGGDGPSWCRLVARCLAKVPSDLAVSRIMEPQDLHWLVSTGHGGDASTNLAMSEGLEDACAVLEDKAGDLVFVVPMVTLHLQRPDGFVLVQVSRSTSAGSRASIGGRASVCEKVSSASCSLPTRRCVPSERPREILASILREDLKAIAKAVTLNGCSYALEGSRSAVPESSVRYLRTTFKASLQEGFAWSNCFERVPAMHRRGARSRRTPRGQSGLVQRFNAVSPAQGHLAPDIYVLRTGAREAGPLRGSLWAWIPSWEYDWLQGPTGKLALEQWLSDLCLEQEPRSRRSSTCSEAAAATTQEQPEAGSEKEELRRP